MDGGFVPNAGSQDLGCSARRPWANPNPEVPWAAQSMVPVLPPGKGMGFPIAAHPEPAPVAFAFPLLTSPLPPSLPTLPPLPWCVSGWGRAGAEPVPQHLPLSLLSPFAVGQTPAPCPRPPARTTR